MKAAFLRFDHVRDCFNELHSHADSLPFRQNDDSVCAFDVLCSDLVKHAANADRHVFDEADEHACAACEVPC